MTVQAHALADRPVPHGAGRFLLYALGWNIALFGLLRLAWIDQHIVGALVAFQKSVVFWYGIAEHNRIAVTASCSGTDVMALCAGVTLAYPAAWRRRVAGVAGGLALILALNMARIASLYLVAPDSARFHLLHVYVWPAALVLSTVGYVMGWIWWSARRSVAVDRRLLRFGLFAAGALAIYFASVPWAFQSPALLEAGAWTASVGGLVLSTMGVNVQTTGSVLVTGRGAFQITPECLFTPVMPLAVAALCVLPVSRGRRLGYLLLGVPLFFALGVARVLVLALPPFVAESPAYLAHGFYQFVAGGVLLVGAAHWATRREAPARSSWTAAAVLGAALAVGVVAAAPWRIVVEWTASALANRFDVAPLPLVPAGDQQGALALMPGYQLAVACGLWLALTGGRAWRALGAGLGWLFGSQIGFIVGAAAVHAQWGVAPHAIVVRAWALGVPAVIALFWNSAAGTGVGNRWDQAKRSRLVQWAAGQTARIVPRHGSLNVNGRPTRDTRRPGLEPRRAPMSSVSDTSGPAAASAAVRWTGVECVVDASGCDPDALRSPAILQALFRDVVLSLGLTPIGAPMWHTFPGAGGVTGIMMLSESHLSVHTYPETGLAAFDLYCCRPHVEWPWKDKLVAALGARDVTVRVIRRG